MFLVQLVANLLHTRLHLVFEKCGYKCGRIHSIMELTVETNLKELSKELIRLSSTGFDRATTRAVNKAGAKARTRAIKEAAILRNLKAKDVRKSISFIKARGIKGSAIIRAQGRSIPLIKVKGTKKATPRRGRGQAGKGKNTGGIYVKTGAGGSKTFLKGGFITKTRSGHEGIFRRKGTTRLPITEYLLPPTPRTLFNEKVYKPAMDTFRENMDRILAQQINYEIDKANAKLGRPKRVKP